MKKSLSSVSLLMFILVVFTTFVTADSQKNTNAKYLVKQDIHDLHIPSVPLVPIAISKINLNGIWNYKTSGGLTGTMSITQKEKDITLEIISGAECRPAAVCFYTGTLDTILDGNIRALVSNSVTVDKEGGTVTSAMQIFFTSNKFASGTSTNHYVHPEGHEKRWDMEFILTK